MALGVFSTTAESLWPNIEHKCTGNGSKLKYLSGDALTDSPNCLGPNSKPYPSTTISRAFSGGSSRKGRQSSFPSTIDPLVMQSTLLNAYRNVNDDTESNTRHGKLLAKTLNHSGIPLLLQKKPCSHVFFFKIFKSHHPAKKQLSVVSIDVDSSLQSYFCLITQMGFTFIECMRA